MNTETITESQIDQKMPNEIEAEVGVNPHSHEREGDAIVKPCIINNARGGFNVIGPQPNTNEGLDTAKKVVDYIGNAEDLVADDVEMTFIPFVMLTENTTEREIGYCVGQGIVNGKMYPFMRTTKSTKGVKQWGRMLQVVKWCDKHGLKPHGHFEHPNLLYSDRDAEHMCLPIVEMFLQETATVEIFWEHGSDGRCVPFWECFAKTGRFFVTLTAHHLATNEDRARRDVRAECKPTIKTEVDRQALVHLVAKNYSWVMAGADDAPHHAGNKHVTEGQCACGAYTAPFLMQLYAHALEDLLFTPAGTETFINFTSRNARRVHNLKPASQKVKLVRESFRVPLSYPIGPWTVEPFWAGHALNWSIAQ